MGTIKNRWKWGVWKSVDIFESKYGKGKWKSEIEYKQQKSYNSKKKRVELNKNNERFLYYNRNKSNQIK